MPGLLNARQYISAPEQNVEIIQTITIRPVNTTPNQAEPAGGPAETADKKAAPETKPKKKPKPSPNRVNLCRFSNRAWPNNPALTKPNMTIFYPPFPRGPTRTWAALNRAARINPPGRAAATEGTAEGRSHRRRPRPYNPGGTRV